MVEVSIRELKDKLSDYVRRAEAGEHIVVTRRGKRVLSLVPEAEGEPRKKTLDEKLDELARRGVLIRGKGKFRAPPRPTIKLRGEGPTISEMILRDRGEPLP